MQNTIGSRRSSRLELVPNGLDSLVESCRGESTTPLTPTADERFKVEGVLEKDSRYGGSKDRFS